MKRTIVRLLLTAFTVVAILIVAVNALTPGLPEEPAPDLTTTLELKNGTTTTLGELLGAAPAPRSRRDDRSDAPDNTGRPRARDRNDTPFVDLGIFQMIRGRPDRALVVWRAVPRDHKDYARAQRHIGYKIYDQALGTPGKGVAYVNRSMRTDPFDGNVWQDAARIYWHAFKESLE